MVCVPTAGGRGKNISVNTQVLVAELQTKETPPATTTEHKSTEVDVCAGTSAVLHLTRAAELCLALKRLHSFSLAVQSLHRS